MMRSHELWDLCSEIHDEDKEHEYRHHEYPSMSFCPLGECWTIWFQVFRLEPCKCCDDEYEKQHEERWLRYPHDDGFWDFRESLLEHLECGEEYDEEPDPLDRRILLELSSYIVRCDDHEDDRDDETDHEIDYIPMTGSCDSEDIIEAHSDIGDDDRLYSHLERSSSCSSSMFRVFTRPYLTIEFPYDIEEEDSTEELESRNLEEKYDSEGEYDTQYRRSGDSPHDCFLLELWREVLGRHTDEDRIVPTHDEIDEDDVEQCESPCRSEEVSEVALELWYEFEHRRRDRN